MEILAEGTILKTGETRVIYKGERYMVLPLNPQNKHHRGRYGIAIARADHGSVWLKFEDNNRRGKVSPCDLVAAPNTEPTVTKEV